MPNESITLPDNSALPADEVKLSSARAKQYLPDKDTTTGSYDLDPNLEFSRRIHESRQRMLRAHMQSAEAYDHQEYPKAVTKKDGKGRVITATVQTKEDEDAFHSDSSLVGVKEKKVYGHDIHGNQVLKPLPLEGKYPDEPTEDSDEDEVPFSGTYSAHEQEPETELTTEEQAALVPHEGLLAENVGKPEETIESK